LALTPKKEKKILQKAQKYNQSKNWKKAIAQYRILLAEKEEDQSLHNLLGDLLSKPEVNEKDEAIAEFKRAAELYETHGFMAQAIAVYKKIIRLDPEEIENNSYLAELFIKHGINHDASLQLQKVAEHYIKDNRADRAIAIYEKILTLSEVSEKVLCSLADLYLQKSEEVKASEIYVKLWDFYKQGPNKEKGLDLLTKAVELNVNNIPAIQLLSNYHIKNKNYTDALSFLDSVNAKDIKNLTIKRCYALACSKMDRPDDAIRILEEICSQDTNDIDSKQELGRLYLDKGKYDSAFTCWTAVGNHYYEKRDFENYKQLFETYMQYDSENVQAMERLLHVYQIVDDKEKASKLEDKLKEITEDSYTTSKEPMMDKVDAGLSIENSMDNISGEIDLTEEIAETELSSDDGIELGVDLESLFDKEQEATVETESLSNEIDLETSVDFGDIDLSQDSQEASDDIGLDMDVSNLDEKVDLGDLNKTPQISLESELVKDDFSSRYELGIAYKEMGLFEEAIQEFKYALKSADLNLTCMNMLGVCNREMGKHSEAIEIFTNVLANQDLDNNSKAAIYFDMALTYEQMGDFKESYKHFEGVVSLNPDFPDVQEKLDKVKKLISN